MDSFLRGQRGPAAAYTYYGNGIFQVLKTNLYFAGRVILQNGQLAFVDRLGSDRKNTRYYPYGEEYTATTNDRDKFATYFRDSSTGLDYAMNRYYGSNLGRFLTPDPYGGSPNLGRPNSWNRYAYVEGDPVNYYDPMGLLLAKPGDDTHGGGSSAGGGGGYDPTFGGWLMGGVSPGVPEPPERPEGGGGTAPPQDQDEWLRALDPILKFLAGCLYEAETNEIKRNIAGINLVRGFAQKFGGVTLTRLGSQTGIGAILGVANIIAGTFQIKGSLQQISERSLRAMRRTACQFPCACTVWSEL